MAALRGRNLSKILFMKNTPLISFIRKYEKLVTKSQYDTLTDDLLPGMKKYLPGPYPETEEQWNAAAAKYGMHPDEYRACAPDKTFTGDYPSLPMISLAAKDPYYPWDHPGPRLCHNETLPTQFYLLQGDRYDYGVRPSINELLAAATYIGIVIAFFVIDHFSIRANQPRTSKQYPGKGVHYTFELK